MRKLTFTFFLMVCLISFIGKTYAGSNGDKTIVLITDATTNGGDVAQYNWLVANGFKVTKLNVGTDIDLKAPTTAQVTALNAASLVIIGRDVNSSKYDDVGQDVIDALTTPVLTCNPFGAQWGNPQLWFTDPTMSVISQRNLYIKVKSDPIFANSHIVGDSINFANGCAFITTKGAHNGTVIGTNGGNIGIVRFAKNVPYNKATGSKTPKSDRTVFPFQNTATSFSLNADGQAAYYAEIRRMMGMAIEAPKVYSGKNADKTIVMITDATTNGGDVAQIEWLKANGFTVTVKNVGIDIDLKAPTKDQLDALNAADLVIIGRDVNSSKYDDAGQDVIDALTAPVVTCNPFGAQWGNPPLWFTEPTMSVISNKNLFIKIKPDPIFANSHVVGDSINYANGCAFIATKGAHNGSVIGTNGGNIGIVRFAKNVPYNKATGSKTPKSDRTVFPFQNTATTFSLNSDGQAAYYAEIRRIMGMSIEAPKVYSGKNADKTIVMITDAATNGGDVAQTDWLKANGFNIVVKNVGTDIDLKAPTKDQLDALNAADLVIIGRDVNSSKYDDAGQDVIDALTAPVLTCNPFGAQWGNPQLWFTDPTMSVVSNKNLFIKIKPDPIFANSHAVGDSINYANGCAFISTKGAHNGIVIGTNGGNIGIVRFAKNVPYNKATGSKTPKSDRTVFPFQNTATSLSLTADGQAAYYAEIRRMMGMKIEAPKVYSGKSSEKTVVMITDAANGGDVAQLKWLKANDFNITVLSVGTDIDLKAPTKDKLDALNAADLVIIGRDVNSSKYDDAGQDVIDALTVPVLTCNPYGAQWGNPPLWYAGAPTMETVSQKIVTLQVTNDPIFTYSNVVDNSINFATGCAFVVTKEAHNGMVLGTNNGNIGIVRFAANKPYNPATGAKTPKSQRTIFPFQNSATSFSLNADGQAAYYAEICRMMGLPIAAPKVYSGSNADKKIALLTDPAHGGDTANEAWLKQKGFDVTKIEVTDALIQKPTPEFMTKLNTADLVISGRDAWSNVQQAVDSTSTPVIHTNPFGAQWGSPDPFWFLGATVNYIEDANGVKLAVTNDPIFKYANPVDGMVNYAKSLGTITTAQPHKGSVVATNDGNIAIVRFKANVPYNSDPKAKTPKSDHSIVPFQTVDANNISLTKDGLNVYYAEIRRMLGLPIESNESQVVKTPADKSLIVLTDNAHGGDFALITFLTNNGFKVTKRLISDAIIATPPASLMDSLNTADLVVYGRDAWSNVQQAVDATTTPVIHANPYGAQWGSPDKFWFLDAMMNTVSDSLWIKVKPDPIFANSHVVGDSLKYGTGAAFVITSKPHNATVLGTYKKDLGIMRFKKGVPYNNDPAAKTPKSDHTIFPFQTGTKSWTLSHDAQAAYYAEICRMVGIPIAVPKFFYDNPSTNSNLSTLMVLNGKMSPVFKASETVYKVVKNAGASSVTIVAKAADAKATLTGAGAVTKFPSTVTVTVTAQDGVTTTDYVIEITVPTGISDLSSAGIRMYPNPAHEAIKVEGLGIGATVSMINANGQTIFKTNSTGSTLEYNLGGLTSGIYLMKVEQEGKAFLSKFLKQ